MGLDAEGGNIVYKLLIETVEAVETLKDMSKVASGVGDEIKVSFDVAMKGASDQVRAFGRVLNEAVKSGLTLKEAFQSISEGGLFQPQTAQQARDLTEATGRLQGGFDRLKDSSKSMSQGLLDAGKKMLGLVGIVQLARRAISALVNLTKQAIEEYEQFTMENFKLEVGIRAAQRQMGLAAGTTEEWRGFIVDLREQFQIFSTRDLTAATAKILLLTRELGFTKEQMQDVSRAALILAEVTGVKVEEAARRIAFFLDTGMSRGLATLGVQVNRTVVEQEALAQGIDKSWNEMTRAERAAVGLSSIMGQVADLSADAGKAADTFSGKVKTLEADMSDAMIEMGKNAAGLKLVWLTVRNFLVIDIWGRVLVALRGFLNAWFLGMAAFAAPFVAAVTTIIETWELLKAGMFLEAANVVVRFVDNTKEAFTGITKHLHEQFMPAMVDMGNVGEEELGSLGDSFDEAGAEAEDFADAVEKSIDQIEDSFQRLEDASDDAFTKMQDKIEDLNVDFGYDIIEAARDLGIKLQNINRKSAEKRADAIRKYNLDVRDLQYETNNRITEAQRDHRIEELKEEARFNQEMLQLQRRYLFDLEDAVRERDARRVLDLMRRFNLERTEAQEDYDLRQQERDLELEADIASIRRAEAIKRAELRRTLELRLADIERNRMLDRAAARRNYQRELEEIFENEKRRREAIQLAYERRLRDLEVQHQRRLEAIGRALGKEIGMNSDAAQAVIDIWSQAFNGLAQIWGAMQGLRQGMAEAGASAATSANQLRTNPELMSHLRFVGGYAEGGSVVASSPSMALFGERGPERATFTPLRGGGGEQERVGIDLNIRTDEGFIVEVADQVMGEVADVMVNTERGR